MIYELITLHLFSLSMSKILLRLEMLSTVTEDVNERMVFLFNIKGEKKKTRVSLH